MTRLLVSVREISEVTEALAGGSDILDVKEPRLGSLGRADWDTVRAIAAQSTVPVSLALGELLDPVEPPPCPIAGVRFAKLGLAGCAGESDWTDRFRTRRELLDPLLGYPDWIAVLYADWQSAAAPGPEAVLELAATENCRGLLIDTWNKSSGPLSQHLSPELLKTLRRATRSQGVLLALAGSLLPLHVPALFQCEPDVIAVRTAACHQYQRNGHIAATQVAALKQLLMAAEATR